MLFGRILRTYSSDAKSLRVPARWITRIFVGFDVLSFLTQSAGAGMLAGAKDDRKKGLLGQHILMAGLVMQLVTLGFFSAIAVRFHVKMRNLRKIHGHVKIRENEWRPLLFCLYASCILIMIRKLPTLAI
jgi:hypothetical protein